MESHNTLDLTNPSDPIGKTPQLLQLILVTITDGPYGNSAN